MQDHFGDHQRQMRKELRASVQENLSSNACACTHPLACLPNSLVASIQLPHLRAHLNPLLIFAELV